MVLFGFGTPSWRSCTGQKRKVVSLSYNSVEEQPPLAECTLACWFVCRCRTVVNKYWSIYFTCWGFVILYKKTDKSPYFCWFVEYTESRIEYQVFMALHTLNKYLNKRKVMMKREALNVHVYVSLLPSDLLCRNFCWELVDRLSVWFS